MDHVNLFWIVKFAGLRDRDQDFICDWVNMGC